MKKKLKTIAIQGFGFVGAVNSVNVAVSSHLKDYQVLCFEKKNARTVKIFDKASKGEFPYNTNDINLVKKFKKLV